MRLFIAATETEFDNQRLVSRRLFSGSCPLSGPNDRLDSPLVRIDTRSNEQVNRFRLTIVFDDYQRVSIVSSTEQPDLEAISTSARTP